MFDPRDIFLPEWILPSQKQARSRSSSFTFPLPQVFEIGESSYKTSFEHHGEQIETILNHLDELPLKRIGQVEENIEGLVDGRVIIQMAPKMTSTSAAPTMTQAAIKKLVADSVATALEAQATTMTNTDNTNRNTR
nr:hypothetical protein [Tanacetum cinerariifolium]